MFSLRDFADAAFLEEAENVGDAPEEGCCWTQEKKQRFGGLTGLGRENGDMMDPRRLLLPLKLHGEQRG